MERANIVGRRGARRGAFASVLGAALVCGLLSVVTSGCGGSQSRVSQASSSALVLSEYRRSLHRGSVSRTRTGNLLGSSKTLVRSMLGNPYICRAASLSRVAGCGAEGDWVYTSRGRQAGASLRIRFDRIGRVSEASWH